MPQSTSIAPSRSVAALWFLAFTLAAIVHLASAWWHVRHGALNADEGFYAIATRSVAEGDLPYRDFGFTQTPLLLYANTIPLRVFGFGLFAQRAVNGAWALLGLVVLGTWLAARTRISWALVLALSFSLSAPWMYFTHLGKTYGFTSLLAAVAAWVFVAMRVSGLRHLLLGFLVALGTGARLPAAPFFGALWLLAMFPGSWPTPREILGGIGGGLVGFAVVALPFWLAAPDAMQFWIFDFHRLSVPNRNWHLAWQEIFTLAPATWLLAVVAVGIVVGRRRFTREAGVVLASLLALALNLLPGGAYEEYGVPFLAPLAAAAAAIIYDELKSRRNAAAVLLSAGVAAQFIAAPLLFFQTLPERRGTVSGWLPRNAPVYDSTLPAELAGARRIVERVLPADAPFIGPNLILAAETGRPVPRELRMGAFSLTVEMSAERAAHLHLVTLTQLTQWFAQPDVTVLGFFGRTQLNYRWSVPSYAELREEVRQLAFAPVQRDFTGVYREGQFMLFVRQNALSKLGTP